MKKVFYLKSCDTNRKIMNALDLTGWELREIKSEPVTETELEHMRALSGSYEELFSNKSSQIKLRNIDRNSLTEQDYRDLILDHYTFLKRPVFLTEERIFAGNSKQNISELNDFMGEQ